MYDENSRLCCFFLIQQNFWLNCICSLIVTEIIHCIRYLFFKLWLHPYICKLLDDIGLVQCSLIFCTSLWLTFSKTGFKNKVLRLYNIIQPAIVWYYLTWKNLGSQHIRIWETSNGTLICSCSKAITFSDV